MTTLPHEALQKRAFAGLNERFSKEGSPGAGSGNWRFYASIPFEDNDWTTIISGGVTKVSSKQVIDWWGADFYLTHFEKAIETATKAESERSMAVAAVALKRFALRNGNYPKTLDELMPEFTKELPLDCMVGQPLRYHLNSDGTYLLYSVGNDGKDDNGSPEKDQLWRNAVPWDN